MLQGKYMKTDENDFDLTLDNAKEHYIKDIYGCPLPWEYKFYMNNFSKEEFLSWNEEMVYWLIEKYSKENKTICSNIEDLCKYICRLSILIDEYVIDKNIYKKGLN